MLDDVFQLTNIPWIAITYQTHQRSAGYFLNLLAMGSRKFAHEMMC
jgi:hypothetical protein